MSAQAKLSCYPSQDQIRSANLHPKIYSWLQRFPAQELAQFDAVGDIRARVLDESQRLLIHIFQIHDKHLGTQGRASQLVRFVQNNIYQILKFCSNHSAVQMRHVFYENLLCSDEDRLNQDIANIRRGLVNPNAYQLEANSVLRLSVKEGIRVCGTEDRALLEENQRWIQIIGAQQGRLTPEQFQEVQRVMEDREDFLLRHISNLADRIHFVVCGGGHDFFGNVQKWNQKHAEDKFGLINISPTK